MTPVKLMDKIRQEADRIYGHKDVYYLMGVSLVVSTPGPRLW